MTLQRRSSLFTKFVGTVKSGLSRRSSAVPAVADDCNKSEKTLGHNGNDQNQPESVTEPQRPQHSDEKRSANTKRQHLLSFRKAGYERDLSSVVNECQATDRPETVKHSDPAADSRKGQTLNHEEFCSDDAESLYQTLSEQLTSSVADSRSQVISHR